MSGRGRGGATPPDPNDEYMVDRARYAIFGTTPTSENPTGTRTGNKEMKKPLRAHKMMQYYGVYSDDKMPGGIGKMLKENRQIEEEERKRFRDHKGGGEWKLNNVYQQIEGEWPPKRRYQPAGKSFKKKQPGMDANMQGGVEFDKEGNIIEPHQYEDWKNTRDD